jgi:hypothetical protein
MSEFMGLIKGSYEAKVCFLLFIGKKTTTDYVFLIIKNVSKGGRI